MKKIFLIITTILVISSCSFWKEKQENPHPDSWNIEKVNLEKERKSAEENIMEDFVLRIWMKKEDIKKGKYFYPGWKEEEWFQIINPKYPNSKFGELEKLFKWWKMNLPPADWDIETSAWYEKGNMICRLHTKVNATEEEIKNGDYLKAEDRTVTITCFSKENKEDVPFVFIWKKWKCSEFYKEIWRKDLTEDPCIYEIDEVNLPYFSVSFEVWGTWYREIYKKSSNWYEFVWWWHSVTDEQCKVILEKFPDLKGKEINSSIYLDCEERFAPLFVAAYFPNSNIKIKKDTLIYLDEKNYNNPEKTTNYHLNTIKKDWDIVFEWLYVKGKFERKKCMDDWFGVELPYSVEVTIDGKTYKWCWEKILDDFFNEEKYWNYNEIAEKLWVKKDETWLFKYEIQKIDWPYLFVSVNSWGSAWYLELYKRTTDAYEKIWTGKEPTIKDCVNIVNNHSRLVHNEKFPLFSNCEDRLKNAKWDEIDEIYENDENFEEENELLIPTKIGMERQKVCAASALAIIREWVEVKTYIEDMENFLWKNDENVWEVNESLTNFGLELEKVEKEALFFALVESHREEDWTERDITTKSFRIKNDSLLPEEYNVISNDYNELTMAVSGEELEKLKNNYKKDCSVK